MSTSAVSNESLYQQLQSFFQQRHSDLQQLGQALQSGDLSDAQSAFNALQTLGQSGPFANGDPFRNSQREQDFQAIGQALQSGDLSAAQQAFATFEQTYHPQNPTSPVTPPNSTGPAVVVNLGALTGGALTEGGSTGVPSVPVTGTSTGSTSSTTSTTTSPTSVSSPGPEIVINLGANTSAAEQLTIDVNNSGSSGAEQVSISLGTQQNPSSQGEVTLNLNSNSNEQIILNLLNSQAISPSPTSNGLSVVA